MAGKPGYTAKRFINAIPGTGGIVSALAKKVGCKWHTAKKYVTEYPTIAIAWEAERNQVTDTALHNIVKALNEGDLQMSKWWMQVKDDEFTPRTKQEVTGAEGGPIVIVNWDDVNADTD